MSILTKFLGLFKYDPKTDGAETFRIDKALNDNWDKLDEHLTSVPQLQIGGDEPTGPGMVLWLRDYTPPEPEPESLPPIELTADAEGEEVRVTIGGTTYGASNVKLDGEPDGTNYVLDVKE